MFNDNDDALAHVVDVGNENQYVDYVNDIVAEDITSGLDPINQLILLEEMDEYEAYLFVMDLCHRC